MAINMFIGYIMCENLYKNNINNNFNMCFKVKIVINFFFYQKTNTEYELKIVY